MQTLKDIIDKSIEEVTAASELFYQQNINEGYRVLEESILLLSSFVEEVSGKFKDGQAFDINRLNSILMTSVEAMEEKDIVLLSDILNYELKELLIEYREMLL